MERLCYTFDIAPGLEAEYERRHAEVWPELVAALQDAGFSNYSLFRRGDGGDRLRGVRVDGAGGSCQARGEEVNARWSTYIRSMMSRSVDEEGRFFRSDEIWHLD